MLLHNGVILAHEVPYLNNGKVSGVDRLPRHDIVEMVPISARLD